MPLPFSDLSLLYLLSIKKPYTYIKVYGFFVFAAKGRINMTELQLNIIREGRPSQ
jgi:hypothetical protein